MYPRPRTPQRLRALAPIMLLLAVVASPIRAQGRVVPGLAWCAGVTDPADFPACQAAGLDAVRIDVPWTETPSFETIDRMVAAAEEADLRVILALQTAAPPRGPVDPDLPEYVAQAKLWIERAVEHFGENKAVLAWMVADEPEAALRLTENGFRDYVARRYEEPKLLNAAWPAAFQSFAEVSAAGALTLSLQKPLGISRASIDLALYRQDAFSRLMRMWAGAIRSADERRPILTGSIARYRSLISVPDAYDAVVARIAPGQLRGLDAPSEAVAIARRSGKRAAVASISTRDLLGGLGGALMQGAVAIQVEDWPSLRANPAVATALAAALDGWRESDCFTRAPKPTVAILYEPFAESAPAVSSVFAGYLSAGDNGELERLFATFRNGTRFGQVGFVAQEDLASGVLDGYRVLLCPMSLSMKPEELHALSRFAEAGGIIVADLGFGCYEAGGGVASWSTELATLVGFRSTLGTAVGSGTFRIYEKLPIFPSLRAGDSSTGGRGATPFSDVVAMVEPMDGVKAFASVLDRSLPGKRLFGGILARSVGKGWVLYASMKLWQRWSPADPLFTLFHNDLVSRRPLVKLRNSVPFVGGELQVAAFERGIVARNSGLQTRLVTLEMPGERLYAGRCLNVCRPATEAGSVVQAGLAAGSIGLYEETAVRCVMGTGTATIAVEEYGPEGVKLSVCGGRPQITLSPEGTAVMRATLAQPAVILVKDGRYPVRPGSIHLVRVRETDSDAIQEFRVQAGPDGKIELQKSFLSTVISITPVR